jgi:hypothetical protein
MLTPELSVTQVSDDQIKYIVRFVETKHVPVGKVQGDVEVIEHVLPIKDHEKMMKTLGLYSLADFGERFGDVCRYFLQQRDYVDFEEIN